MSFHLQFDALIVGDYIVYEKEDDKIERIAWLNPVDLG